MAVTKVKVQPLADRVLVIRIEEEQLTKGGIIVPDTAKEKPQQGKIVAVGPGRVADDGKRIKMEVKKGDKVLFGKYAGTEISIGNEEYLILREDDILAIVG
jgi:chaperonin GroES